MAPCSFLERSLAGTATRRLKSWCWCTDSNSWAANLFTLMGTCRRQGVEPYEYLCDIVPRMGRHPQKDIWELTLRGWRDARAKAAGAEVVPA